MITPLSPSEPATLKSQSLSGTITTPSYRPKLLVVDDQAPNIQALYHAFAEDHQVFVATSGSQAIKMCREKQPDLVLLDIVMPQMDGYEVCTLLKADKDTSEIPVIFVTGETDEGAETRGLDVGAVDFITKPINPRIVRARVRTHVTLKRQSDHLRGLSLLDGLTGIANRRCFDERLDVEWRRAHRNMRSLSLLMVDVDHFKRYNDFYGHAAGDECLRLVAQALSHTLTRPGDLVARYGGEEFACLLPETEPSGAMAVARMLEQRVRDMARPHAASPTHSHVSVSIGVGHADGRNAMSGLDLVQLADQQLYRAKGAGRGRVCGAEPAVDPTGT
jgi:diguanylate cyclase (GGDEF)-like protein